MTTLRDKILRALYGGALVGTALGTTACAGVSGEENNEANHSGWTLNSTAGNNQTSNNTSTNNTSTNNTSANNQTANNQTANNTSANNQTANNTTSVLCEADQREHTTLPYDGWKADIREPGRYIVCTEEEAFDCAAPGPHDEFAYKLVEAALGPLYACSGDPDPYPANGSGDVCGPVPDPAGEDRCCYYIDLDFQYCLEGRPFTVDGRARLAEVQRRSGWCDPLELSGVEQLPMNLREEIAAAWAEAGTHEHASVASFSRFLMDLLSLGAPRALVQAATRAIDDEIEHARACFSIASVYAGFALGPDIVNVTGSMEHAGDEAQILRATILEGCIGETLAANQAEWVASKVADPTLRDALTRIADDEGEHAALAWGFVRWMLQTRPHLEGVAREAFRDAWARQESPYAIGMSHEDHILLAHGRARPATEDRLRRGAFHEIVVPCASALFDSLGADPAGIWPAA